MDDLLIKIDININLLKNAIKNMEQLKENIYSSHLELETEFSSVLNNIKEYNENQHDYENQCIEYNNELKDNIYWPLTIEGRKCYMKRLTNIIKNEVNINVLNINIKLKKVKRFILKLPSKCDQILINQIMFEDTLLNKKKIPYHLIYPSQNDIHNLTGLIRGSQVLVRNNNKNVNGIVLKISNYIDFSRDTIQFTRNVSVRIHTWPYIITSDIRDIMEIPRYIRLKHALLKVKRFIIIVLNHIRWNPNSKIIKRQHFFENGQKHLNNI